MLPRANAVLQCTPQQSMIRLEQVLRARMSNVSHILNSHYQMFGTTYRPRFYRNHYRSITCLVGKIVRIREACSRLRTMWMHRIHGIIPMFIYWDTADALRFINVVHWERSSTPTPFFHSRVRESRSCISRGATDRERVPISR